MDVFITCENKMMMVMMMMTIHLLLLPAADGRSRQLYRSGSRSI